MNEDMGQMILLKNVINVHAGAYEEKEHANHASLVELIVHGFFYTRKPLLTVWLVSTFVFKCT